MLLFVIVLFLMFYRKKQKNYCPPTTGADCNRRIISNDNFTLKSTAIKLLIFWFSDIQQMIAVCIILRIFAHAQGNFEIGFAHLFVGIFDFCQTRTRQTFLSQQSKFLKTEFVKKRQHFQTVDKGSLRKSHTAPRFVPLHAVEQIHCGFVYQLFGCCIKIIVQSRRKGNKRRKQNAVFCKVFFASKTHFFLSSTSDK